MPRLLILVAVLLLSGCLTAPPKQAAKPTLMPRAQSYKDLTHLPAPTGKIFVSVYNIQDETGQFNLTRQVTFLRLCRRAPPLCWSLR
ncbi:assembly/transport component in curli production [Salmonella enterica subsp. enterica]|uniref:Assembly/transport component in curli production n=1 Tax=Salmonella enterica I TaxID=59201 RepID=A0A379WWG2_SALET|nr:assembly/transport component in curli production [Salmonella enterica subsp. enterica]